MEEESTNPFEGLDAVTSGVINDAPTATASAATIVATTASRSRFSQPSSVTLSRSLGFESTRLLFMGDNFRDGRNDQEVFYDCEDSPLEGRSVQSQSRSVQSGRSARSVQSGTSRCNFDDPAAIREALERAANATQMLLTNFDKAGGWNSPCTVTLELTARLVDPKKGRTACPMHGKPVTVQMPLEFNPQSGKIASCQTKKKPPLKKAHKAPKPSICQCQSQSQRAIQDAAKPPKPTTGKSASEQFVACDSLLDERSRSAVFVGSCGDSSRSYCCHNATCRHRYDPEAREIISICYLPVPEPESEPEEEVPAPPVKEVEPVKEEPTHVTIEASDTEPEYVTEESSVLSEIEELVEEKAATPEPEQELEPEPPEPKKSLSGTFWLCLRTRTSPTARPAATTRVRSWTSRAMSSVRATVAAACVRG